MNQSCLRRGPHGPRRDSFEMSESNPGWGANATGGKLIPARITTAQSLDDLLRDTVKGWPARTKSARDVTIYFARAQSPGAAAHCRRPVALLLRSCPAAGLSPRSPSEEVVASDESTGGPSRFRDLFGTDRP